MIRKVLIVHNEYQKHGGEDSVVVQEENALKRAGYEVQLFTVSNKAISSFADKVQAAFSAFNSPRIIKSIVDVAREFRPDVAHVHNFFPMISPMIHAALQENGIPTVQTLHNYRVICAGATLNRNGAPCEICITKSPYNAVLHRCYRGSLLGSLAVAYSVQQHKSRGTWSNDVDRFIVLTEFERSRFIAAGLPAERIKTKPNGLADPDPGVGAVQRHGLLFVGRLTHEKGVDVLVRAAQMAGCPIKVLGEGPLQPLVEGCAEIEYLGQCEPSVVRTAMAEAAAMIVPSVWYEGLPMVIVEAFASGTPVIASRIGSLIEIIEDGVTGIHTEPGDAADLARAMTRLASDPAAARRMGKAARLKYEQNWSEALTTSHLLSIYEEAVASYARKQIVVEGSQPSELALT
ncbi:glycosyltransferase family 4 protein [Methylobacterium gnaphalii]|uniref:Glycosyl transferase n=1 Tax=Methylobacterium gnaphalii TaxID=1010610 RepID=A0A512JNT3_9HYPH|nr:glycosyltransferase family 4 protein [Methylobacterium gnaphalii]GEP11609.1 glycosyl transferase [Methylobacterium gnaphalii]GJD69588.1 D-inositol-3-phosphate glycosyltransferase [Methylobacterium gnaphalii]GLS49128.1 glycosyl transferase [Methylobacterium gnaphalii]